MGAGRHVKKDPAKAREVELKLELGAGSVDQLLCHPLISQARPLPHQGGALHAIYYDTADHALRGAGLTLRVRRQNGHCTQTIKAERKARGLSLDRGEWEVPVDDEIDLAAAAGTPLAELASNETIRNGIRPVFTVETDRRTFEIEREGAIVELALDEAKALAATGSERFCEVELELKDGDPAVLFSLADDLAESIPLRLSTVTKSERGYRLLGGDALAPFTAATVTIPRHASCAEAFQIVARSCLSQVIRNEALLRFSPDPEVLHQMRVGFRRLKAAATLFKSMLSDRESEGIRAGLRWAGKKLGAARDLDVLIAGLRKSKDASAAEKAEAERRRSEAYEALLTALSKPRFMRTILKTAVWIESGRWRTRRRPGMQAARERPAVQRAARELSRRWKRIRKEARHMADLDEAARHKLRIRIKKLRYGVEFFSSLFPGGTARKRRRSISAIIERLQDVLGELNDIGVGHALLGSPSDRTPAHTNRQMRKLLSQAEATSGKLLKAAPFWT